VIRYKQDQPMTFLDQIDQPTLVVDEIVARRNIERMVNRALSNNVSFRPHFKTHQSAAVGEWFREKGVSKMTVSSVEMAEYFAQNGWQDITIAFSTNIRQLERIRNLAQKIHLGVLVENMQSVESLSQLKDTSVDVWVKIDVGNKRTGLDWQQVDEVFALCSRIIRSPTLILKGLLTHSGHTYKASSKKEVCSIFREGISRLTSLRDALEKRGLMNLLISVGDTPGCSLCEDWSGADEVRPGNFVFYDAQQLTAGVCIFEEIAAAVACPVVAKHASRHEIILYGGAIHLSKDFQMIGGEKSYGLACLVEGDRWGKPIPGAIVKGLSQEHGVVSIPNETFDKINIGDLLFIIPAHSCLTVQVLRKYQTLDGRQISTLNQ
jgi:D-serine deaminase-like pyridoxal phosphate-dependent protein